MRVIFAPQNLQVNPVMKGRPLFAITRPAMIRPIATNRKRLNMPKIRFASNRSRTPTRTKMSP